MSPFREIYNMFSFCRLSETLWWHSQCWRHMQYNPVCVCVVWSKGATKNARPPIGKEAPQQPLKKMRGVGKRWSLRLFFDTIQLWYTFLFFYRERWLSFLEKPSSNSSLPERNPASPAATKTHIPIFFFFFSSSYYCYYIPLLWLFFSFPLPYSRGSATHFARKRRSSHQHQILKGRPSSHLNKCKQLPTLLPQLFLSLSPI